MCWRRKYFRIASFLNCARPNETHRKFVIKLENVCVYVIFFITKYFFFLHTVTTQEFWMYMMPTSVLLSLEISIFYVVRHQKCIEIKVHRLWHHHPSGKWWSKVKKNYYKIYLQHPFYNMKHVTAHLAVEWNINIKVTYFNI